MPRQTVAIILLGTFLFLGFVTPVSAASADTQIRKPTDVTDQEGSTYQPEQAFDFPESYDQSTSSNTSNPNQDPSVNWSGWNTTDKQVYTDLTLSVTVASFGFNNLDADEWAIYFDNSTDTVCDSSDRVLKSAGSENLAPTNFTRSLPRDQDLQDIQVCLWGSTTLTDDGSNVSIYDIRTNASVDADAPLWRNQQQNQSAPNPGDVVELAAQGWDTINLSHATLATNETGSWQNTSAYGSPIQLFESNTWAWSNFTWRNDSITSQQTIGWKLWYNDTNGNYNVTDTTSFTVTPPELIVSMENPPSPFTVSQNTTFTLNATVTCRKGDCGEVNATARYNNTGDAPDTSVPESGGEPFHTVSKDNPLTCATSLTEDERCNATWEINATGQLDSLHSMDVNVTADAPGVVSNNTSDVEVKISGVVVDILLRWSHIEFGSLFVGTQDSPAEGNSNALYNTTVTEGSTVDVDLWLKGTDFEQQNGPYSIGVTNTTWNTAEDPGSATQLTDTFSLMQSGVSPGTNVTSFYWIDVPSGIAADTYNATLEVKANETG